MEPSRRSQVRAWVVPGPGQFRHAPKLQQRRAELFLDLGGGGLRNGLPAGRHPLEARQVVFAHRRVGQHVHEAGRHRFQHRRAVAIDRAQHRLGLEPLQQHQRRSAEQAAIHHRHAVNMRAGQRADGGVGRSSAMHQHGSGRADRNGAVGHHGALRMAGRARGVADRAQVIERARTRFELLRRAGYEILIGHRPGRRLVRRYNDPLDFGPRQRLEQRVALARPDQQQLRAAIAGDVADFACGQHGGDRVEHGAGLGRAEIGRDPVQRVRRAERHPVAGPDALGHQGIGEPVGPPVQRLETAGRVLENHRRLVSERRRGLRGHLAECHQHCRSPRLAPAPARPGRTGDMIRKTKVNTTVRGPEPTSLRPGSDGGRAARRPRSVMKCHVLS